MTLFGLASNGRVLKFPETLGEGVWIVEVSTDRRHLNKLSRIFYAATNLEPVRSTFGERKARRIASRRTRLAIGRLKAARA